MQTWLPLRNGEMCGRDEVPELAPAEFHRVVSAAVGAGARLAAFFAQPLAENPLQARLYAVLARGETGGLLAASTLAAGEFPSLTPDCPAAHLFEREIAEQFGLRPVGHPWLKPVRYHSSYAASGTGGLPTSGTQGAAPAPGVTDFFRVEGEEVHEVAVGPVHAGIIEPGHFRFQCHGENVYHLEIALGYQHRGVERALIGGPRPRTPHYAETLAGDTTIAHATAYCEALEALSSARAPARAQALRGIALELERLANHTGDLGALAGDVGYLPAMSYCGRLRGDFLNMTALLCGNRFGRGLVRPGGVRFDLDAAGAAELRQKLARALKDLTVAVNLLWETPSVLARFEETGTLSRETCLELGLVGVAARACGLERDARFEFPSGIFQVTHIPVAVMESGDVFARAYVRWLEIQRSAAFIQEQLDALPAGELQAAAGPLAPGALVVSLIEGWRGEVCHVALTDGAGCFARYKVVDPSFHNWTGLALALRNQQISDFPLCNKSFNLSYCGHDL